MITRLYVNNFRCLVAFEAQFDSFGVLCGANGAGKSSVFDAIRLLRNLGTGDAILGASGDDNVPILEFTAWMESQVQEFEISVDAGEHSFLYGVHIEQTAEFEKPRIVREKALCDGQPLFERDMDGVRFTKSDGTPSGFLLDWRQTALSVIRPRGSNASRVVMLREELERLLVLRPNPRSMERESKGEVKHPDLSMTNLTSWYRSLAQEQDWTDALRAGLRSVWPDFRSFKLVDTGLNAKALQLRFEPEGTKPIALYFDQLSDGERALIGLYMVRAALETGAAKSVLVDEPDNFVGLPELQPWVLSVRELLDQDRQMILISHHPEILASSGEENGRYLWRDNHTSPARIGPLRIPAGISAGEAIARGWANE